LSAIMRGHVSVLLCITSTSTAQLPNRSERLKSVGTTSRESRTGSVMERKGKFYSLRKRRGRRYFYVSESSPLLDQSLDFVLSMIGASQGDIIHIAGITLEVLDSYATSRYSIDMSNARNIP